MRFYCVDKSAHAYVDSKIESDYDSAGKINSVIFSMPVEAAAVDSFVEELRKVGERGTGAAFLRGASGASAF